MQSIHLQVVRDKAKRLGAEVVLWYTPVYGEAAGGGTQANPRFESAWEGVNDTNWTSQAHGYVKDPTLPSPYQHNHSA